MKTGLIKEDEIYLTKLGQISVREKKLFHFFKGSQNIYEHTLKSESPTAMLMFPFYKDMGIYTQISLSRQIWPEDDDMEDIIYSTPNQLKKRIELQSKNPAHIYNAKLQPYFDLDTKAVPIMLYLYNDEYIPAIMNGGVVAVRATELICEELNVARKENVILECLFQKLWDDRSVSLTYEVLEPYFDLVDFEELTKDSRTVWSDLNLLKIIADRANATSWRNISRYCDIDVLREHIKEYKLLLDWPILSERIDDEFLIQSFLDYPWDLEVISEDVNRKESVIEQLILLQKKSEEDWNWDELEKRLSQSFVLDHLDVVKVNLAIYTKDTEEIRKAILDNIDKKWDWNKIENDFDLQFIYEHIIELGSHLAYTILFDRVFTSSDWAEKYVSNPMFRNAIQSASEKHGTLSSAIFNGKNYKWSEKIIGLFEENDLICWSSSPYMIGFECNPHLIWTKTFFNKYAKNVISEDGKSYVSSKIRDVSILIDNPFFGWNWECISANTSLLSDTLLYTSFGTRLNWSIVLKNQTDSSFLQSIPDIHLMIGEDEEAWSSFSSIADVSYVVETYRDSQYPWDWTVLTERMFDKLKLDNIGNRLFVDKWNWAYLSEHVNIEFLNSNLERYSKYWDWGIVLPRVLTNNKKFDYSYLDVLAVTLTNISERTQCQAAWTALTSQYSFKELKKIIKETIRKRSYWWDINYFCQHKDFSVFRDLIECRNIVDWDILSSSSTIDNSFKFNPKLGIKERAWHDEIRKILSDSENHWNFKLLSHFESLRDEKWFLKQYKDVVDWDYISLTSKVFCEKDKQLLNEVIEAFKTLINFSILSEREDVDINQIIKINPRGDYDYNELAKKKIIGVTLQLVESMPDYPWDWRMVTSSPSFYPTAEFLLSHIDCDINWKILSSQDNKKTWGNENLVLTIAKEKTISEQIDWHQLSSFEYFPLSKDVLSVVPHEAINWKRLSKREDIASYIDDYADYFDWEIISENRHVIPIKKDIDILDKYKDYLDWGVICNNRNFVFTNDIVERFSEYIDWSLASASQTIQFSRTFVEKYLDKWNWPVLVKNKAFNNIVNISELPYAKQINIVEFIEKFPRKPKAYHFTHMDNAVKIIRSMKLQCRNLAEGNFSNSAGTNVHRTCKAHRFARFYFMPKSPTQFYNECLGKDTDDNRYYKKARDLGLPKCPLPVFFIFDVEELLSVMPDICYYSNGNMQKDSSCYFKVIENPNRIKAKEIYIDSFATIEERQQEFLVDGELDFSKLKDVQIFCYDSFQAQMLRKELKGTKWEDKVSVGDEILYEHQNKELYFNEKDESIEIKSNYRCPFEFRVSYSGLESPQIINKQNVIRQRGNNIFVSSSVEINKNTPFEVYFEVSDPRSGSWLVYKNS